MSLLCPACKADQSPQWDSVAPDQIEGRDWHCPSCKEYLMMFQGRVFVLRPPPPGGGSPLPPSPPGR